MEIVSGPLPPHMGVTQRDGGLDIAVFSRNADRIFLCTFDAKGDRETARLPLPDRTGDIHHGFLPGAGVGLRYGLRADGPYDPGKGNWFDPAKLLIDPYALQVDRPFAWHSDLAAPRASGIDTASLVPRCVVVGDEPVKATRRFREPEFIYELNIRTFTMKHPDVPQRLRGTLKALMRPAILDHLVKLGVTHLELMPIAAWIDERHLPPLGLRNAWGYNPVNFFALDPRLAPGGLADLRALTAHFAMTGIDIIIDVVFNHTGESDEKGATLCLRGLDNATYYRHDAEGRLINDTGCGHTIALDRPPVLRLAMDALRMLKHCGVAGFRFDLAPVLGRQGDGGFSPDAPLLAAIAQDPELADCLMIAEPWDIGPGGYQLGAFPVPFREWNGHYRDDVRRFWRGDQGITPALATRLAGSSDLFQPGHRSPHASINFVAIHDGFTLADTVAFADKHNQANGEDNRDGTNENFSWNNGVEGPNDDAGVNAARSVDMRALLATLFVSRGVPMIQAGDEGGRTQHGNNNAYAQDGEDFWIDWADFDWQLSDFIGELAALRRELPPLRLNRFFTGRPEAPGGDPDIVWLSGNGMPMEGAAWDSADVLGLLLGDTQGAGRVLLLLNRRRSEAAFPLPQAKPNSHWNLASCSTAPPPALSGTAIDLPPRTVTILREQSTDH